MKFYPLKIQRVIPETSEASTLIFEVPEELSKTFNYAAGQYVTIEHPLNGEVVKSAFSISSAPHEAILSITIKNGMNEGLSHFLTRNIREGDVIQVTAPRGNFGKKIEPDKRVAYYFIGAGSGITPLYSMIKTILEVQPLSTVHLLYGNRTYDDIIFRDTLVAMTEIYQDQFYLRFTLSQHGSRPLIYLDRNPGRIDQTVVERFLEDHQCPFSPQKFFICGPETMTNAVESALLSLGIGREDIHCERFGQGATRKQK
jgi:ring-1,2-phenylacetyl-CoA epoxidase subunit PaaE